MGVEGESRTRMRDALERVAVYALGMVQHHEQHGFGEARSWRVILHDAYEALDLDGPDNPPPGEPLQRGPSDDELERLVRRSRSVREGSAGLALTPGEAHELLGQLAAELLLWRHSHPDDLPG